jgi:regulator of protease activity HflC (stomatin/prohibitin superfamily)
VPQLIAFSGQGFKSLVKGASGVYGVQVPAFHVVVLYVDGKLHGVLEPGVYAFWKFGRDLRAEFVDMRLQALEVAGQEILTKDKVALANVIRRREETAATRSLLNSARVMEDNPTALRLKELETLEKVTEKIDRISVFGGLDAVLKDLVKIR